MFKKQTCGYQGGKSKEGINWEIGIDINTVCLVMSDFLWLRGL